MTLLHSWGPPSAGLGDDNDWCINHLNYDLYGPKSGTWSFNVNLIAPSAGDVLISVRPTVFQGTGPPQQGIGGTGDWYIDTNANIVYELSSHVPAAVVSDAMLIEELRQALADATNTTST